MEKLIGLQWKNVSEYIQEQLLNNAKFEGVGNVIIELNNMLAVNGYVSDSGALTINDDAIIYDQTKGLIEPVNELPAFEIDEIFTLQEAAEIWGVTGGAIRGKIKRGRLIEGIEYRNSGRIVLITKSAMIRHYGKIYRVI